MDDLDRRLIALLRENARTPIASLAKRLGVSRGTAQNRLDKLLERGDILGFSARLRSEEASAGVRAISLIQEQTKNSGAVMKALRRIPEATAIYTTNGRWDIVVEMAAQDLAALDGALSLMRRIEGVVKTETLILLTPHKM
jgi:DNA-binding Lrp family transcriptional regulator